MPTYDIEADGLRGLNEALHALAGTTPNEPWEIVNPRAATPSRWGWMRRWM
jgi:hypothetical protein